LVLWIVFVLYDWPEGYSIENRSIDIVFKICIHVLCEEKKPRLGNIIDLIFDILNFIHVLFNTSSYMYQRPLLTTFPNTENKVENATGSGIFLTNFEMFGNVVKHCLERLIYLPN